MIPNTHDNISAPTCYYISLHMSLSLKSSIIALRSLLGRLSITDTSNGRSVVRSSKVRTRLNGT